jgi:diguanylate cyclase (GGDEF)-like protein
MRDRSFIAAAAAIVAIMTVAWAVGATGGVVLVAGMLLPLAAAVGCVAVARQVRPLAAAWRVFALAALFGALAHAAHAPMLPAAVTDAAALLRPATLLALAGGVLLLIHSQASGAAAERGLDSALLGLAALAAALHLGASGGAAGSGAAAASTPAVLTMTALLVLALPCAILLASWLATPARAVALLIAAAALLQGLAASGACCAPGALVSGAAAAGWLALLFAGAGVLRGGVAAGGVAAAERGAYLLRQTATPTVALLLGALLLAGALRTPLSPAAGMLLALLALLLAVRIAQLLGYTRRLTAERRELAHSRALVEVSQALAAGSTELDDTLQLVTDWASRLFGARGAAIELLAENDTVLVLHSVQGLSGSLVGLRSPVDSTFTGWVVRHGQPRVTLDPRTERDMAPAGLPVLGDSPVAAAPLRFRGRTLGALACIGNRPFDTADLRLLGALAEQAAVAIENARLFREVRMLSLTDPLTGLANRRQLERDLSREFGAARRGRRLVAVMFDLDGFKGHNDRHGHLAGDAALGLFGEVLSSLTRRENQSARFGGDEFLSLLTDTDLAGAAVFVRHVQDRFAARMAALGHHELSVTAGMAEYAPDMAAPDDLVAAADRALYDDKPVRVRT